MFICSMRMSKKKMLAILLMIVLAIGIVVGVLWWTEHKLDHSDTPSKTEMSLKANNVEDLAKYVQSFGWEIEAEPEEVVEVAVPETFQDVYENYNALQKRQGFDLEPFKGKTVTRTTFVVTNYPNYPKHIRADVLTYQKRIIGGDICSIEIAGFMHGLNETANADSAPAKEDEKTE